MTGARVDNDIYASVLTLICFDEVISAAESTDALFRTKGINVLIAEKSGEIGLFVITVGLFTNGKARRYLLVNEFIKLLQFNVFFLQFYGLHSAAYINAYEIRDYLVRYGHGSTYGTA